MQNKEGVFIVIEGTDGSGKSTQFELLTKRLEDAGYDVATFKFPQYNEPSSYFVKQYLKGVYGSVDEVGPYTASLFYALDRFAAAEQIRDALAHGKVVVVDRYTGSNMAHQGTKFHHADQRRGYFIWLDNLEFEMLRIPRPDANFVLNVPADITQQLLAKSEKKRDIHETDIEHLKRSVEVFHDLCGLFPKDFVRIDCVRNHELLPIETVNNLIWEKIFPLLPTEPRRRKVSKVETEPTEAISEDNPYIEKTRTGTGITAAGRELLKQIVTDSTGDVYAFKDTLNATVIAAAIASSSHRPQDLRTVILDTFSKSEVSDEAVQQAMTRYEFAIRKLIGLHLTIEQCSFLSLSQIRHGRHTAFVTPDIHVGRYDERDEHGQYRYLTPDYLTGQVAQNYRERMDKIFDNYVTLVDHLTHYLRERASMPKSEETEAWRHETRAQACRIASAVLPVATKTSVSMFASAKDVKRLIRRLHNNPLPEAHATGDKVLSQVQQIVPPLFDSLQTADKQKASSTMKLMAEDYLPDNYAADFTEPVTLSDFWPRNELDLVPDMLYAYSNLPLAELKRSIDKWPYERKAEVLTTYLGKRQGRVLEKAHYSWEIVSDYTTFLSMLKQHMVDNLAWQQLTPRNGYEVPTVIEDAGLSDTFEACFDMSLELHSILFEAGYPFEAQYATLMGHRLRWSATYNACELRHLQKKHADKASNAAKIKLAQFMYEKLAEVHPIIADSLSD